MAEIQVREFGGSVWPIRCSTSEIMAVTAVRHRPTRTTPLLNTAAFSMPKMFSRPNRLTNHF
jgi:hypothetical protein